MTELLGDLRKHVLLTTNVKLLLSCRSKAEKMKSLCFNFVFIFLGDDGFWETAKLKLIGLKRK